MQETILNITLIFYFTITPLTFLEHDCNYYNDRCAKLYYLIAPTVRVRLQFVHYFSPPKKTMLYILFTNTIDAVHFKSKYCTNLVGRTRMCMKVIVVVSIFYRLFWRSFDNNYWRVTIPCVWMWFQSPVNVNVDIQLL